MGDRPLQKPRRSIIYPPTSSLFLSDPLSSFSAMSTETGTQVRQVNLDAPAEARMASERQIQPCMSLLSSSTAMLVLLVQWGLTKDRVNSKKDGTNTGNLAATLNPPPTQNGKSACSSPHRMLPANSTSDMRSWYRSKTRSHATTG